MIQEFLTPAKWETWNTGHEVFCFRPLTWELAIRGDEATFVITCDHRHYHLMCQIAIWYSRYHPSTASIFPILRFLEKGTRYCVSSKKELPWLTFFPLHEKRDDAYTPFIYRAPSYHSDGRPKRMDFRTCWTLFIRIMEINHKPEHCAMRRRLSFKKKMKASLLCNLSGFFHR